MRVHTYVYVAFTWKKLIMFCNVFTCMFKNLSMSTSNIPCLKINFLLHLLYKLFSNYV